MALIVQKFGGSSVKDRDRIFNVARIVANTHKAGNDVVVVVSAQGDTTDDLIAKAAEITHNPSAREMDMLLAAGEEISIALLAMALNELGCHATSLTGWQAGFRTDRAYTCLLYTSRGGPARGFPESGQGQGASGKRGSAQHLGCDPQRGSFAQCLL